MKLDPKKSFGYPVLRPHSDDYIRSAFQLDIDMNLSGKNPSFFSINFAFHCGVRDLTDLVFAKKAFFWLRVNCRATFYSKMIKVEREGSLDFDFGDFRDVIDISGFIIASESCTFRSGKINPEFGYDSFEIDVGQVLAHSDSVVYSVEKDFWRPIQSIFEYQPDERLNEGEFYVDLESESGCVSIRANVDLIKKLNRLERAASGKAILINSVFFPVVVQMIMAYQQSEESIADSRWGRILMAKAAARNLDLKNGNSFLIAQRLLNFPLSQLTES
jgi:hypothetical protein